MKRLTSKRNGKWTVANAGGKRKKVGVNPLYLSYRVFDRLIVGKDKPGNSW